MRRLLAATDLSSRSDRAVRRAADLAQSFGAELLLLHVVDDDQPVSLIAAARREVTSLLRQAAVGLPELSAVAPRVLVEEGDAFDGIIRAAEKHAVDLVVLGTHRRRLLQDILVGTTIERVIRLGSRPVLMVNRLPTAPYRRILAAVDPEEGSAHALRSAAVLGLLDGADLTVLHAFDLPGKRGLFLGDVPAERIECHLSATAREVRADLTRFLAAAGLVPPPTIIAEEGRPASVIKDEVKRLRPDLLLIGAGRHGALRRAFLGSVASEVIADTDYDILIVPSDQGRP